MIRHRPVRAAIIALLLAGAVAAPAQTATNAGIEALSTPEPMLRQFLAQVVFRTNIYQAGMMAVGIKANCALLRPAFEQAVAEHMPAWRANLVAAHRQHVPAEVLDKAVAAGPVAGAALIEPYRAAIGADMKARSTPILEAAARAALKPSMDAIGTVDMAKVDRAARLAEAQQARADRSVLCGLL